MPTQATRSSRTSTLSALFIAIPLLVSAPVLLAGCASNGAETSSTSDASHDSDGATALVDGWAKSADKGGMSGLFGSLENHGSTDLVITGVESDAAGTVELHEVTSAGVMQPIAGDVVVPAGGSFQFSPGADHIMLMDLTRDLLAGDEVEVLVSFDDGSSTRLAALVKDYAGANEDYGDASHDEMSHAEHGAAADDHSGQGHDGAH